MSTPDLYALLGVPPDASLDEIRRAYRARAPLAHPDRGGSHRRMEMLNRAWNTLSKPESRETYDLSRATPRRAAPAKKTTRKSPPSSPPKPIKLSTPITDVSRAVAFKGGKLVRRMIKYFQTP